MNLTLGSRAFNIALLFFLSREEDKSGIVVLRSDMLHCRKSIVRREECCGLDLINSGLLCSKPVAIKSDFLRKM
ncbi:hypothetical protein CEXT_571351 [Caerostris extrusa]|uniref:Secreted protein n=1 Tax=Caerostris extrusa TaxID=172846 RepID=A0AAV4UZU1_CAEEX|nr:hypothetical protein CEXT_571351 [Caerostris extrusa]